MWATVAKYLVKVAIWAAGHPEVLDQVLKDAKAVADKGKAGA